DGAHELECIALLNDAYAQAVIENHLSVFQMILEVSVRGARRKSVRNLGQSKIVRRDQADGSTRDQSTQNRFSADRAIVGVRPMEDFVQQKDNRHRTFRQYHDVAQPLNLGVEA